MNIPRDKIIHAIGGLAVALATGAAGYALIHSGLNPLAAAVGLAGTAAALSVEAAQWWANRASAAAGVPPMHKVSPADALATAAPGWVVAVVLHWVLQ